VLRMREAAGVRLLILLAVSAQVQQGSAQEQQGSAQEQQASVLSFGDTRWGSEQCRIMSTLGDSGQRMLTTDCIFSSQDMMERDARIAELEATVAALSMRLSLLEAKAITTPNVPPFPPLSPPFPPSSPLPPTLPPIPPAGPPPPPSVPAVPSPPSPHPPIVPIDKGFRARYDKEVTANGFKGVQSVSAASTETLYVGDRRVFRIHWPILRVQQGYTAIHAGGANYNGVRTCNIICEALDFQGVDPGYGQVEKVPGTSRQDPYGPYQSQWCNAGCSFFRSDIWQYNYAGWNMCDNCPNKMAWCDCTNEGSKMDHAYWQGCCS